MLRREEMQHFDLSTLQWPQHLMEVGCSRPETGLRSLCWRKLLQNAPQLSGTNCMEGRAWSPIRQPPAACRSQHAGYPRTLTSWVLPGLVSTYDCCFLYWWRQIHWTRLNVDYRDKVKSRSASGIWRYCSGRLALAFLFAGRTFKSRQTRKWYQAGKKFSKFKIQNSKKPLESHFMWRIILYLLINSCNIITRSSKKFSKKEFRSQSW
jgi:hypothetical protein